jgi:hypothetical protein
MIGGFWSRYQQLWFYWSSRPDRPWVSPNLLYNGKNRSFPLVKLTSIKNRGSYAPSSVSEFGAYINGLLWLYIEYWNVPDWWMEAVFLFQRLWTTEIWARLAQRILNWLTPCSRALLEKQIITQSRNSPPFMEPEGSLTCSHGPVNSLCPDSDESSPHPLTLFP